MIGVFTYPIDSDITMTIIKMQKRYTGYPYLVACVYIVRGAWRAKSETGLWFRF
jgi:hypothetical protein